VSDFVFVHDLCHKHHGTSPRPAILRFHGLADESSQLSFGEGGGFSTHFVCKREGLVVEGGDRDPIPAFLVDKDSFNPAGRMVGCLKNSSHETLAFILVGSFVANHVHSHRHRIGQSHPISS